MTNIQHFTGTEETLKAAAADLFAALEEMTNAHSYASTIKERKAAYIKARAALAKAQGRQ